MFKGPGSAGRAGLGGGLRRPVGVRTVALEPGFGGFHVRRARFFELGGNPGTVTDCFPESGDGIRGRIRDESGDGYRLFLGAPAASSLGILAAASPNPPAADFFPLTVTHFAPQVKSPVGVPTETLPAHFSAPIA